MAELAALEPSLYVRNWEVFEVFKVFVVFVGVLVLPQGSGRAYSQSSSHICTPSRALSANAGPAQEE
jgi:hypothetical protein